MIKNKSTVLAVDMGNTSVSIGLFQGTKLVRKSHILTHSFKPEELQKLSLIEMKPEAILISSVVPERNAFLKYSLTHSSGDCPVYFIGKDLPVPVVNKAKFPEQVGVDRLVNALQAFDLFKTACIAVDFGTAITFDVVSKKGEYLGGVIAPGIELTLNALFEKTSLLPKIKLKHPHTVLGRSTEECIRSGCSFGLGALCDGILEQLAVESKTRYQIIATGGYARFMTRYSKAIRRIDEDLNLKGIHLVFLKSKASGSRSRLAL